MRPDQVTEEFARVGYYFLQSRLLVAETMLNRAANTEKRQLSIRAVMVAHRALDTLEDFLPRVTLSNEDEADLYLRSRKLRGELRRLFGAPP